MPTASLRYCGGFAIFAQYSARLGWHQLGKRHVPENCSVSSKILKMDYKLLDSTQQQDVSLLFKSAFTASEGKVECELIGNLASQLASAIDNLNIICIGAYENEKIIGSIFFTRLMFDEPIMVYMLAPVAVDTGYQGMGIGQALIMHGLNILKSRSVSIVITYGDPSFYSRVGFEPLSENIIKAPIRLSMPDGWLGQSLTRKPIPTIKDRPRCVNEFNDPVYW